MCANVDRNLLKKLDQLDIDKTKYVPDQMSVAVTNKCPNLCQMCCTDARLNGIELDVSYFRDWFEENKIKEDIPHFWITGGEPLIHQEIVSLLKFLHDNKLEVGLGTSGCSKGEYHELYYHNLEEIVDEKLVDKVTLTWAPAQGKDSWKRVEDFIEFYKKSAKPTVDDLELAGEYDLFDYPFELKKNLTFLDSNGAVEEYEKHFDGFYTKGRSFYRVEDWEREMDLKWMKEDTIENIKKYWSGRTGKAPEDEGICGYTSTPTGGLFLLMMGERKPDISIGPDGTIDICCSVKAATSYKHLPKVGSIYEDSWTTIRDRFAKMHTLLQDYAKKLEDKCLKHTCYRCVWDTKNSFENYLKSF